MVRSRARRCGQHEQQRQHGSTLFRGTTQHAVLRSWKASCNACQLHGMPTGPTASRPKRTSIQAAASTCTGPEGRHRYSK
eukprot:11217544-Lingulodinium_polyedra.AAC.1